MREGLVGLLAMIPMVVGCADQPVPSQPPQTIVVDDFETGTLTEWKAATNGSGGWSVGTKNPPQGKSTALTTANGPGTRLLYRDLRLDGRFSLHMSVFYSGSAPFSSPETLAHDAVEANQQFRIDLVNPAAPIDSVGSGDVLANVFRTSPSDPSSLKPTEVSIDVSPLAGQTVRLRLAEADNQGPLEVGVDNIRFERLGVDGDGMIELLDTQEASSAIDIVLHRLSEADALAALSARAQKLADADEFSGVVLVARQGDVLLQDAFNLADRKATTPNTLDTKFRIGSMNKMFTAVAVLQLVEAGKLGLDDPIGKHLLNYPNDDVASKVTVRHLLSHTGGTGDIFGPEFERNRLALREHSDYVKLYGARGPLFEPGARFEYSNYGFVLLGAIIEAVSGASYYDHVRENVFGPSGMIATASLPESDDVPGRSVGYTRSNPRGTWQPNTDTLPWRGTSAGGGYSTVGDLMRFAEALTAGTLISKATLGEATSPQSQEPYGFGLAIQGEGSLRSYGHGGGAPGMNGELRIFPELGYVIVSLSNLDPPAAGELVEYFALRMPDK